MRELSAHDDSDLALDWVTEIGRDLKEPDYPAQARSLGRTLIRRKHQIAAWHRSYVSTGRTGSVNNLIKRPACGFTPVPELPDPLTLLGRQAQLRPARLHQTELRFEAPGIRPICGFVLGGAVRCESARSGHCTTCWKDRRREQFEPVDHEGIRDPAVIATPDVRDIAHSATP